MSSKDGSNESDFLLVEMDISFPVSWLKLFLKDLLQTDRITSNTRVFLKENELGNDDTLRSSCVVKDGLVYVKCRLKPNCDPVEVEIDDVLLGSLDKESANIASPSVKESVDGYLWKPDLIFIQEQEAQNISSDPKKWSIADVRLWLSWARSVFRSELTNCTPTSGFAAATDIPYVNLSGQELCSFSREDLVSLVVPNAGFNRELLSDLLMVHLNLLKQEHCVYRPWSSAERTLTSSAQLHSITPFRPSYPYFVDKNKPGMDVDSSAPFLWRFILECLVVPVTNSEVKAAIFWTDTSIGEFKIANPGLFAKLWSISSGKYTKTTSKESIARTLRKYCTSPRLFIRCSEKCDAHSWTYRFAIDLEAVVGYSAYQLSKLCDELEKHCD